MSFFPVTMQGEKLRTKFDIAKLQNDLLPVFEYLFELSYEIDEERRSTRTQTKEEKYTFRLVIECCFPVTNQSEKHRTKFDNTK
jgi:hypothetical protein